MNHAERLYALLNDPTECLIAIKAHKAVAWATINPLVFDLAEPRESREAMLTQAFDVAMRELAKILAKVAE